MLHQPAIFVLLIALTQAQTLFGQDSSTSINLIEKHRFTHRLITENYNSLAAKDYDALFYRLNVVVRKNADSFNGDVVMRFKSLITNLQKVEMDLSNVATVDSVIWQGRRLIFTHQSNILTATLQSPLPANSIGELRTYYRSPIQGSALTKAQRNNVDKQKQIITISSQAEPFDARKWWPCKDDPRDKADSVDIIITTDKDLFPGSNGTLISDIDNGDGTHTVRWEERYPIVTYLVSIAIADFNHHSATFEFGGKKMPVEHWYFSIDSSTARRMENYMLAGLQIFSSAFGAYPFMNEKYGMAEYVWGGAMEHQTLTSMGFYGESVTIHELAHQWFGDKVTCEGFEHIWVNEGWATYCEALYYEARGGKEALKQNMIGKSYFGPGTIYVENPLTDNIFDGNLSYNKGSWVLHMMRHAVGDSAFFKGVRTYLGDTLRAAYRTATTKDFQTHIENASGYKLDSFIKNWIYGEYFPTYKFTWNSTPEGNGFRVDLTIQQMYVPQRQVFDLPIDITFYKDNRDTTIVVRDSSEIAQFTFRLPFNPTNVVLDKDNWILKKVLAPLPKPTFEKPLLLVNGVSWDAYTQEIRSAYADSIFTGKYGFDFVDLFPTPSNGYPPSIKTFVGNGNIVPGLIGKYCTVVWIGNAYTGDDVYWGSTPIAAYLKAGGNVILLSRQGRDFIDGELQDFLGLSWTPNPLNAFRSFQAEIPQLLDMNFINAQDRNAAFLPTFSRTESTLLFSDSLNGSIVGTGVWGKKRRIDSSMSGNFIFISLRPYRVNHAQLRTNMEYLISQMECAPITSVDRSSMGEPVTFNLMQNYPNPIVVARTTNIATIEFDLHGSNVQRSAYLQLYDQLGRLVRTYDFDRAEPGMYRVPVDVSALAAGNYFYRLMIDGRTVTKRMVVTR